MNLRARFARRLGSFSAVAMFAASLGRRTLGARFGESLASLVVIGALAVTLMPALTVRGGAAARAESAAALDDLNRGGLAACCYEFGVCVLTPVDECEGTYYPAFTACNPDPCPGACCNLSTGVCTTTDSAGCPGQGSINGFTAGEPCTPTSCLDHNFAGACCDRNTGVCVVTGIGGCANFNPAFFVGQVCSTVNCPQGRCCNVISGNCSITGSLGCTPPNMFDSSFTCMPDTCPKPAACCNQMTGMCVLSNAIPQNCPPGAILSPMSSGVCTPDPCPKPMACCSQMFGMCTLSAAVPNFCPPGTIASPTPSGACMPDPCPKPAACCNQITGMCVLSDAIPQFCPPGSVLSPNPSGACIPDPCPKPPVCCFSATAGCTMGTAIPNQCPPGSTVLPGYFSCPSDSPCTGACCTPGTGNCITATESECTDPFKIDGTFMVGTCMPDDPCPKPKPCCNDTGGNCLIVMIPPGGSCPMGSSPPPSGTSCTPDLCPKPTPCCEPSSGVCTIVMIAPGGSCPAGSLLAPGGGSICTPNPCPPVAKCKNITLDATASCIDVTIHALDVDNGSFVAPGVEPPPCTLTYEVNPPGPFPVGMSITTLTVTDCKGRKSSCTALITVLGQDCNNNGIPDQCECFWSNGETESDPNGVLSHIGGAVQGGARAADDFYLPPCRVYRIYGFSGHTITNSLPGLYRKARLDFYDDCDGKPGAKPIASFTNGTVMGTTPSPSRPGYDVVNWYFDFCTDSLWLDGGKCYWVSLVGLSDGQTQDESSWAIARPPARILGSVPHHSFGPATGNPPITFGSISWGPWSTLDDCCPGCVNLDFNLHGESCPIVWDNGPPRTDAVLGPVSSAAGGPREFRALDNFMYPHCEGRAICLLETWVWTNCNNPKFFLELYRNECGPPGVIVPVSGQVTSMYTGFIQTLNSKTFLLYKISLRPTSPLVLGGGTYWVSAGATDSLSINGISYFAQHVDACAGCAATRISPPVYRQTYPPLFPPPNWVSFSGDLAFRIALKPGFFGTMVEIGGSQGGGSTPNSCPADLNDDGKTTVKDLFDFLAAWFAGCP